LSVEHKEVGRRHRHLASLMRAYDERTPMAVLRKVWVTTFGWVITLLGIAALVLPGPGLLLLLAGLVILSQEYAWAERRVEPIKIKASGRRGPACARGRASSPAASRRW
jgi:hypothetical protein